MFAVGMSELAVLLFFSGGFGLALGVPPGPEDATLARVAPEQCLLAVAWNGMAAPDPKSPNQTEQLLAEPEVQKFVAAVDRAILAKLRANARAQGPEQEEVIQDFYFWTKTLLAHPAILYLSRIDYKSAKESDGPPRDLRAGLVVNTGDQTAKIRASLEKFQKRLPPDLVKPVQIEGDTFYRMDDGKNPVVTWGTKDNYLGIAVGAGEVEAILKRGEGEPPRWLTAGAARAAIARPSSLVYVNVKGWIDTIAVVAPPEFRKVIAALGLDRVTSFTQVCGLDNVGVATRMHIGLEGEPGGILKLVQVKPLAPKDLGPIPADSHVAAAARVSAEKVFDTVLSIIAQIDPQARRRVDQSLAEAEGKLGLKIREDLLRPLGDSVTIYSSPGDGAMFPFGLTAVVPLSDAAKLRKSQEKLLAVARQAMAGQKKAGSIERTEADGHVIYYYQPAEVMMPVRPAWAVTDRCLVASLSIEAVKAFVTRKPGGKSLAEVPEVAAMLSGQAPLKILYQNTPELFKLFYPTLQLFAGPLGQSLRQQGVDFDMGLLPTTNTIAKHLRGSTIAVRRVADGIDVESHDVIPGANLTLGAPVLAGLLLPAVQAVRDAARRTQSMSNMKQVMLVMHMYADDRGRFPPAYSVGKDGKPLLSWRVHVLPYLKQQALYKQFHLDEPWDSPNNKKLIEKMPLLYRSPRSQAGPGKTTYLTVRGKDTVFPGSEKVTLADIKDGTSSTIALVEVNDQTAVVWTRPDDYQPDAKEPLKGLRGTWPQGFLAALADGSVHVIPCSIKPEDLKALFTRSGGEIVNWPGR